ncbi:MAG: hypothetical protein ABIQ16_25070 [Polyangiaceae bacterium]
MTSIRYLTWLQLLSMWLGVTGCSLFYDLNATQCRTTPDCAALGPSFAETLCVNQVCVASNPVGTGGDGDGGSSGQTQTSGAGGKPASSGGGGAAGGGASGDAGAAPAPECTTNADCISAHVDQPYLCKDGSCLALTSSDCPVLLPSGNTLDMLKTPAPIVVGGFANMNNQQDPHDSLAVINWDLAFSEFNAATLGGLPVKGGKARPLLALVCQGGATDINSSLRHLTEEVQVPGILSTLSTDKLFNAFNFTQGTDYAKAGGKPTLFLSTGSADLRLANLPDDGLVWHMLGDPRQLAATTVALLNRIIPAVNAARTDAGEDVNATPLRVTLVYSDDATMTDLFSVLTTPDVKHPETSLAFNGKSAISQLASGDFREVKIQSAKNYATPVVSNAITDLEQNPPHIVLAMATSEFPKTVMPNLENSWGNTVLNPKSVGMARPFYLLSHFIYNTAELQTTAGAFESTAPPLSQRTVGVNYAAAQDTHSKQLYDSYEGRLQSSYQGSLPLAGTENYYDGAYSLLYSLAAAYAARTSPGGDDVRDGLQDRVFSAESSAPSVNIGPATVGATAANMSNLTYKMALWGTMGPPNFDRTSGTRLTPTSAWCIKKVSSTWAYQADGLLYDPDNETFSDPVGGVPTCLMQYPAP